MTYQPPVKENLKISPHQHLTIRWARLDGKLSQIIIILCEAIECIAFQRLLDVYYIYICTFDCFYLLTIQAAKTTVKYVLPSQIPSPFIDNSLEDIMLYHFFFDYFEIHPHRQPTSEGGNSCLCLFFISFVRRRTSCCQLALNSPHNDITDMHHHTRLQVCV